MVGGVERGGSSDARNDPAPNASEGVRGAKEQGERPRSPHGTRPSALNPDDELRRDTQADLERARRNLEFLEATPRHRIADMMAFLDNVANQRAYVRKLEWELDAMEQGPK